MSDSLPPEEVWDEELAAELQDSVVLVGLTFVDREENLVRQEQLWGRIVRAERGTGIQIELHGTRSGDDYWLPPDTRGFQRAEPGEYRLRSTGEFVVDPDFTSSWTITEPED